MCLHTFFSFVFTSGFFAHKALHNYLAGKTFDLSRVQLFEMFYPLCAVNLDDVLICQTSVYSFKFLLAAKQQEMKPVNISRCCRSRVTQNLIRIYVRLMFYLLNILTI